MSFTHLHLHTLYSLLDGAIRMKDLIKTVKAKGMTAVAVTDHGNMFGAVDFYKKAKDAGIKPIIGMEAYVAGPKGRGDRTEKIANHLILLAKNDEGYANLRYLVLEVATSRASTTTRASTSRCSRSARRGSSASPPASAARSPAPPSAATWTTPARAAHRVQGHLRARALLPRDPVERHGGAGAGQRQPEAALARPRHRRWSATADSHYIKREDARAHEILMCIASGKTLADDKRLRHRPTSSTSTAPEEMRAYFSDCPEAVDNTHAHRRA